MGYFGKFQDAFFKASGSGTVSDPYVPQVQMDGVKIQDASGNLVDWTAIGRVNIESEIPQNAAMIVAGSADVANATASASLPATANRLNWITGFTVTGSGATAGSAVNVTVAGLIGGITLNFTYCFATGVAVANQPLNITFPKPIPASAPNTAITVSCPAGGSGAAHNTVNVFGFQTS